MEPNSAAADYNRAINNTQATLAGSSASVDAYNPSNTQATLTPIAHNANNTQATLTQATLAESSRQTLSRTPTADSMRAAEKGHSAEKGQVGTKPPAAGAPAAGGGPPAPPGLKKYTHGCKFSSRLRRLGATLLPASLVCLAARRDLRRFVRFLSNSNGE